MEYFILAIIPAYIILKLYDFVLIQIMKRDKCDKECHYLTGKWNGKRFTYLCNDCYDKPKTGILLFGETTSKNS